MDNTDIDNRQSSVIDDLKKYSGKRWSSLIEVKQQQAKSVSEIWGFKPPLRYNESHLAKRSKILNSNDGLYPEWDEFYLEVCDKCGIMIRPRNLQRHMMFKHQVELNPPSNKSEVYQKNSDGDHPTLRNGSCTRMVETTLDQSKTSNGKGNAIAIVQNGSSTPAAAIKTNVPVITLKTSTTITATSATNTLPIRSITDATKRSYNNNLIKVCSPSKDKLKRAGLTKPISTNFLHLEPEKTLDQQIQPKLIDNHSSMQVTEAINHDKLITTVSDQLESQQHTQLDSSTFIDPSLYGLEPLIALMFDSNVSNTTTYRNGKQISSMNMSSTSPSSTESSSSTHGNSNPSRNDSTINQHKQMITLPMVNSYGQSRAIMHTPSTATMGRYHVNRKWGQTYNVLRDAFL